MTCSERSVSSKWPSASAGSIRSTIGPTTLSPEENRLLAIARVLLAAPRFVFLDRMDGDLTLGPDRAHLPDCSSESGISYLSVGDHDSLDAHHEIVLTLGDDGAWEIIAPARRRPMLASQARC